MKQVKKLLVILPLVALFVLGSLPVLAVPTTHKLTLTVKYFEADGTTPSGEDTRVYTIESANKVLSSVSFAEPDMAQKLPEIQKLAKNIKEFVMGNLQNGYILSEEELQVVANQAYADLATKDSEQTINLKLPVVQDNSVKVIAFNIHNSEFVYDRLFKLDIKDGWHSEKDISEAFYNNTETLKDKYLYAGFATKTIKPVIIYRATYLERIAEAAYMNALDKYGADIVVFVVPRIIKIETIHVFPEGTRANLTEIVPVPYEVWASLQHSSQFMNLPEIFKTRIQKVNEEGYTFREIRYYNGENEIDGLLAGYDWFGMQIRGEIGDDDCFAKIFYDKAVAAAKEVPTEKKVDAATAPQAQIQAPAAGQAQAPVTAANTTTTTAPVNTLPVTGASDSIFLFLSSAALMAVGILFFKKH